MPVEPVKTVTDDPLLFSQWGPNNQADPSTITLGSNHRAEWVCSENHTWYTTVGSRAKRGSGCPYCTGKLAITGVNDLLTLYPEVAAQFIVELNKKNPNNILPGNGNKYWWECSLGHQWQTTPRHRTERGQGCPYCANKKVLTGFNDLETLYPEVAAQWSTKNKVKPSEIIATTSTMYLWECEHGHEWEAKPNKRVLRNQGCPYCSGRRAIAGKTDLLTIYPDIAAQWHPTKNGDVTPVQVTSKSGVKYYWLCSKGHDWKASVAHRANGTGCPKCSNRFIVAGENDLATAYPEVVKYWDYEKNEVAPTEISPSSGKQVWIKCVKGHSSHRFVYRLITDLTSCKYCSNNSVLLGYNDLLSTHPELLDFWDEDTENNAALSTVTFGSNQIAHWKCINGHRFTRSISAMVKNPSCVKCNGTEKSSAAERELAEFISSLLGEETEVKTSDRSIISPYELDMYVPAKGIAIEFNGLYWHSEKMLSSAKRSSSHDAKTYHHTKWKLCDEKGIQLITVWEDDWRDRPEAVKSMLAHKLGVSTVSRVMARKTEFIEVSKEEAQVFLDSNHIQGYRSMTRNYGLRQKSAGDIVAIMSFSVNKETASLDRYATSCIVSGGFTKLLKASIKELPETVNRIISFSDNEVSDGAMYLNNGFVVDAELTPDYKYVYEGSRHHKFLFRKKRFKEDPALEYDENMTERELAKLNNLDRVWDSGKIRWAMEVNR